MIQLLYSYSDTAVVQLQW